MSDEIKETVESTEQVESNENSDQQETTEQQSTNTLTAFEIEKIVEMKVQEILSKLQKADEPKAEDVEVEEDVEF